MLTIKQTMCLPFKHENQLSPLLCYRHNIKSFKQTFFNRKMYALIIRFPQDEIPFCLEDISTVIKKRMWYFSGCENCVHITEYTRTQSTHLLKKCNEALSTVSFQRSFKCCLKSPNIIIFDPNTHQDLSSRICTEYACIWPTLQN